MSLLTITVSKRKKRTDISGHTQTGVSFCIDLSGGELTSHRRTPATDTIVCPETKRLWWIHRGLNQVKTVIEKSQARPECSKLPIQGVLVGVKAVVNVQDSVDMKTS